MAEAVYEALLRRRRIWGVPPDAVAEMAAASQREQTELRARVKELESRLARANAERDDAIQNATTLQERVAHLEQENHEIANRPETVREEAVRFVVDAWTEAQTLREQTRVEIEEAEAKARDEVAAIRRQFLEERRRHETEMAGERQRHQTEMADERRRYEAEIAALRERRQKVIVELESLAVSLLAQAARSVAPHSAPAASDGPTPEATASLPAAIGEVDDKPPAPPRAVAASRTAAEGTEDQMLAKALDDLEAILNASRKPNGG